MDDQREEHPDPKRPLKNYRPQQLHTHNVPTDHVKNTNGTNKEVYLLLANKTLSVPRWIEKMPPRDQRNWRATIHWSTHPQEKQNEMKKSSYGLDWQWKAYDMIQKSSIND